MIRRLVVVLLCLLVVASGVAWSAGATVTWQKEGGEAQTATTVEDLGALGDALSAEQGSQMTYEGEPMARCYLFLSDEEDNEKDEKMKEEVDRWSGSGANWIVGVEFQEEKLSEAEETWDVANTPAFVATLLDESGEEELVDLPATAPEGTTNPIVGVGDEMIPSIDALMAEIQSKVEPEMQGEYTKVYTVKWEPDPACEAAGKPVCTDAPPCEFRKKYDTLANQYGNTVANFEPSRCGIALWGVLAAGAGLMGLGGAIYRRGARRREP